MASRPKIVDGRGQTGDTVGHQGLKRTDGLAAQEVLQDSAIDRMRGAEATRRAKGDGLSKLDHRFQASRSRYVMSTFERDIGGAASLDCQHIEVREPARFEPLVLRGVLEAYLITNLELID